MSAWSSIAALVTFAVSAALEGTDVTRGVVVEASSVQPNGDDRRRQLDVAWRLGRDVHGLGALLQDLAASSDGRARLVELGRGRDGRPLHALEVGPPGAPGLAVFPSSVHAAPSSEAALHAELDDLLDVARALVLGGGPGGPLAASLGGARVVLVVGARPDLLAPALAPPPFDVTRNYPVDADLAARAGGGPYPLACAETRAVAAWLDTDAALFAAVLFGAAPLDPGTLATGDWASDREQEQLAALPAVVAACGEVVPEDYPVHGGFARHARLRAGLAVLGVPRSHGDGRERRMVAALLDVLAAAPRLELALSPRTRPVGADLWQLEATLANVGGLATGTSVHAHERRRRGVTFVVPGAELVLAAVRTGDGAFEVVDVARGDDGRGMLRLGDLAAGGRVEVRLFVRTRDDLPVELGAVAPRAAATRSFVTLARER